MRWINALGLILGLASPAMAAQPATRLVSCPPVSYHAETCLLVSGHRNDPASAVLINGHAVPVEGQRHWRTRLPVETIREWSAPFARRIEITVGDAQPNTANADLPIGLLGHTNLAVLVASRR